MRSILVWPRSRTSRALLAAGLGAGLAVSGCSQTVDAQGPATTAEQSSSAASAESGVTTASSAALWDTSTVHSISIEADSAEAASLIETYLSTGEKEWMSAAVTIDGVTYENVGIKLKGNSSLRGISADTPLVELPWRIRFDKYVDGQSADGVTDITVRSNNSETSMNEAVALDMLAAAGLATENAAATSFTVNGGEADLRLTVENLNEEWVAENFPDAGADSILYKAEAGGTWDYQGEDADYSDSFDLEVGPDDYGPLISLLDLLANGSQEELAEDLPNLVDLESFATYLAFQDIIANADDIDGPGNNSYLFWDSATQQFTVVAWDHNLAFGSDLGQGGFGMGDGAEPGDMSQVPDGAATPPSSGAGPQDWGGDGDGQAPEDGAAPGVPEGAGAPTLGDGGEVPERPEGAGDLAGGGPGAADGAAFGGSNPLVDAMQANADWSVLIADARAALQASLVDSGVMADSIGRWQTLLTAQASDLVPQVKIDEEADDLLTYATPSDSSS